MMSCNSAKSWSDCLNCILIETVSCPLDGEDALEKIANRIRMGEDPSFNGYFKDHLNITK
ncbi:MAG: hypothetical protein JSV21_06440 [Nitrospirota bacterium]|nr:MAG: hypothetical protein JSV21_06440 [Nitrospirota bacterium]